MTSSGTESSYPPPSPIVGAVACIYFSWDRRYAGDGFEHSLYLVLLFIRGRPCRLLEGTDPNISSLLIHINPNMNDSTRHKTCERHIHKKNKTQEHVTPTTKPLNDTRKQKQKECTRTTVLRGRQALAPRVNPQSKKEG